MRRKSNSMIITGIAAFIAVLAILLLLGVAFWASLAVAVICAIAAQWVTGRQVGP